MTCGDCMHCITDIHADGIRWTYRCDLADFRRITVTEDGWDNGAPKWCPKRQEEKE